METYEDMSIVIDNMLLANATIGAVQIQLYIDNLIALGATQEYQEQGIQNFVWITVNGRGACPDCQDRGGTKGTMEYFMGIGEPRSGWSICGHHCNCQLEPDGYYEGKTSIQRDTKGKS